MPKIVDQSVFVEAAKRVLGDSITQVTRKEIAEICAKEKVEWPNWLTGDTKRRLGWGIYAINKDDNMTVEEPEETEESSDDNLAIAAMAATVTPIRQNVPAPIVTGMNLVPTKATGYVPFGAFNDLRAIVKSKKFYPAYITGLSGNGKTFSVEQVAAAEGRELIRTNITVETDESDLLGHFALIDGHTVWQDGPVVTAMERGALLLLDEVDLGSNKLLCLQPVLEGKSVYLKKINRRVDPAPGFNVFATANTKGKGSDDGRFIGTNVINEAFLDRFPLTFEQEYPNAKVEAKILNNVLSEAGTPDPQFVDRLIVWAGAIRKSFQEGAVSEVISTRRLVNICDAFGIFNSNRTKAIELCVARFDEDTKKGLLELYKKLDEQASNPQPEKKEEDPIGDEVPF